MMWKCKTGYMVNQKQITTLLDTLYCFYEHVLQSIHYAVCPFESLLLYRSYKETCEWLFSKPWKSGQNWAFLLLFESASLKPLPGEFLEEAHPFNTHSKSCIRERRGETWHNSSWFKMVVLQRMAIGHPVSSGRSIFSGGKEIRVVQKDLLIESQLTPYPSSPDISHIYITGANHHPGCFSIRGAP